MIATVRSLTGRNPRQFFGDNSDPSRARVRDLQDEARRVFRSRVVNPKWMQSMQRHGYKGAFELAATVDYMFGYDATAQVVEDWMYENVTEEYVLNPEMQEFFRQSNPWALRGIVGTPAWKRSNGECGKIHLRRCWSNSRKCIWNWKLI